ncbi:MAG: microbial rhodopsin family protein [Thermoleophilia bacterium]
MDLTSTQELILWLGTAGMALGAVIIAAVGFSLPNNERHHVTASFFVCAIAACAYLAMATGTGVVEVAGQQIFYARYIDWVVTTPLLLLGLLTVGLAPLTGGGDAARARNGLIGWVLGADVLMIATGLIASLRGDHSDKWIWYVISCVFFLLVLWALYSPVKAHLDAASMPLFKKLLGILTILWFIYPILWVLGTEGTGTLSLTGEILVFAIIDVLAKVGFGIVLVTGVKSSHKAAA